MASIRSGAAPTALARRRCLVTVRSDQVLFVRSADSSRSLHLDLGEPARVRAEVPTFSAVHRAARPSRQPRRHHDLARSAQLAVGGLVQPAPRPATRSPTRHRLTAPPRSGVPQTRPAPTSHQPTKPWKRASPGPSSPSNGAPRSTPAVAVDQHVAVSDESVDQGLATPIAPSLGAVVRINCCTENPAQATSSTPGTGPLHRLRDMLPRPGRVRYCPRAR